MSPQDDRGIDHLKVFARLSPHRPPGRTSIRRWRASGGRGAATLGRMMRRGLSGLGRLGRAAMAAPRRGLRAAGQTTSAVGCAMERMARAALLPVRRRGVDGYRAAERAGRAAAVAASRAATRVWSTGAAAVTSAQALAAGVPAALATAARVLLDFWARMTTAGAVWARRAAHRIAAACRGGSTAVRATVVLARTALAVPVRGGWRRLRTGAGKARTAAAACRRQLAAGASAAHATAFRARGALRNAARGARLDLRTIASASRATSRQALEAIVAGAHRALGASGPASAAAAVVVFVMAATLGQSWRIRPDVQTGAVPGEGVIATADADGPDQGLVHLSAGLDDPSISEERRVAIVEEVARDSRDAALDVLLAAAESPSVVVSMASVRALRGRPCSRVGGLLVRRLSHRDWQRRAWAAKVLGENGCVTAAPALRRRLANERDRRVREQLSTALATFGRGTPG